MFIASVKRIIKSGWQNIFRDGGVTTATIFVLVLAITLITSIFLFQGVSQFLIPLLEEKADISIYFKEDVSEDEILEVREKLKEVPEVRKMEYTSKGKALDEFTKRHQENPVLIASIEEVGKNPFLASLSITAFDPGQYESIIGFFEKMPFSNLVEKIDYYERQPVIERIFSLAATINRVFLIFSISLGVLAILVTFNTIRLAIYNSAEKIKIQRLVGASNWFIRGPFLVQGIISGIFAALICLLIFSLVLFYLSPKLEVFLSGFNLFQFFINNFWMVVLIQFGTGILLGAVSSFFATRKYLRV